jgi:hypothetical protein
MKKSFRNALYAKTILKSRVGKREPKLKSRILILSAITPTIISMRRNRCEKDKTADNPRGTGCSGIY